MADCSCGQKVHLTDPNEIEYVEHLYAFLNQTVSNAIQNQIYELRKLDKFKEISSNFEVYGYVRKKQNEAPGIRIA